MLLLRQLKVQKIVQLKVIPSYFQILVTGLSLQTISGVPILGISQLPLDRPVNQILKRIVDIIGATIGLIIFAPIIAVFTTLVYLESGGPVFYKPRRLGRGGVPFDMIKIRSMKLNADKEGSGHWTLKDDPRRLRIGAFMRKWNIDELPQFWNVLKGDMSLVGPRPPIAEEVAQYEPWQLRRLDVRPGLTCLWQISGRSRIGFQEWMRLDRKSTRLNSSHVALSRMPSSA